MNDYALHRFRLPELLVETFSDALWEQGTIGIHQRDGGAGEVVLDAYFLVGRAPAAAFGDGWKDRGVQVAERSTFTEQDWLASYRAQARPFDVGVGYRVDPRDEDDDRTGDSGASGERTLLRIPARTAFGTGSHESTRLAVSLLEVAPPVGRDVLDVGSGSGILSLVALHLGARSALGFDLDRPSVLVARQIALANLDALRRPVAPVYFAGRLAALRPGPRFDLALVNVLPERIRDDLPRLVAMLRPGAHVISSGNLTRDRAPVLARWAEQGLRPVDERREEEWIAYLLERCPP